MLSLGRTLGGETLDTVEYAYDALGRMVSKSVGGKVAESYEYDIRGWTRRLTASRDTSILFSEAIRFEAPQMPGTAALYSGNISEIETVQYGKATDIYAYSYDGFSRLSDARHFIGGASGASNTNTERLMEYDLNGNRLTGAAESSAAGTLNYIYAYDSNGNRTLDSRTGLEFTHNLLNLPCDVKDVLGNMKLRYTYLSDGTKASDVSTPALSDNRYRYAGKEEQRFGTFDSQLLDFGARYYDPWTCQWTAVDPMAEKYVGSSPTSYCALNPVNIVDLNGMDWYQCDSTGYYTWFDGSDDREGYTYIGGKGALFGDNESFIDESYYDLSASHLYVDGTSIEFASKQKGIIKILHEFKDNCGPLITIFGPNHPLTKSMANMSLMNYYIVEYQNDLLNGETVVPGKFTDGSIPWKLAEICATNKAMNADIWHFIGSASYNGKLLNPVNKIILNVVCDCKSRTSLFLHIPEAKSRNSCSHFGNNYQIYIWSTKR